MTIEEAIKILHPDTTFETITEIEYYGGFKGKEKAMEAVNEACVLACEALEKQMPKKPICKEMPYSEEVGLNDELHCPTCGAYVGYFTEGMNEPEQMEYCNECGQHIAKDWSEEE